MSSVSAPSVFSITADVARERTAAAKARLAEAADLAKMNRRAVVDEFVRKTAEPHIKTFIDAGENEAGIEMPIGWTVDQFEYFDELLTKAGFTFEYPEESDDCVCYVKW